MSRPARKRAWAGDCVNTAPGMGADSRKCYSKIRWPMCVAGSVSIMGKVRISKPAASRQLQFQARAPVVKWRGARPRRASAKVRKY